MAKAVLLAEGKLRHGLGGALDLEERVISETG
jgi:hypothetical protein